MHIKLILLCLFCGLLFFLGLGDRDLVSSHEARAAQNAQMILDEGHWLVPRLFDRHLELQKPPLYYWLVASIAWLLGGPVDVWAVRLPAALSALATVLFLYFLGIRRGRPIAGLIAAFVLATCLHFTWLARVGRIDMPLTMAITFALGGFHLGSYSHRLRWSFWSYTWLAVGLLLKGPIAIVLPGVVAAAVWLSCSITSRNHEGAVGLTRSLTVAARNFLRTTTLWWGVPWMLALAGPWYLWANWQTNNQLFEVFFWYHNVERGLGGGETLAAHPWWFYLPRVCVDLLPWSLAIPFAVAFAWRNSSRHTPCAVAGPVDVPRSVPTTLDDSHAGLLWFAAILMFLSCMSFKRADYLLPAYPGMAIFLGACAERWWRTSPLAHARAGFVGVLSLYAIGWLIYVGWYVPTHDGDWVYRRMAAEIRCQTKGPIIFFRAEQHLLALHLRPADTILEWENLQKWADRSIPVYFVMPEKYANERDQHLAAGSLVEVLRTTNYVNGRRDRPLVVLRNRGQRIAGP